MPALTSGSTECQRFDHFRRRIFAVAICASIGVLSAGLIGAGTTWVVSFTIDAVDGVKVFSDTGQAYADYRIAGDPSICVEAEQSPTGGVFAVLNRKINDIGTRCNPSGSDRQFRISINAPSACLRIFNAYGPSAVSSPDAPCELLYNDNPRVRIERIFSNQTRTAVAFLTVMNTSSISYEIRADTEATVTAMGPNQARLTYMGKAHLWEFGNGKTRAVADAFDLQHQMTFTRYAR